MIFGASYQTPPLSIEFKITIIFLMQAIIATFLGFKAANNC
jgi:hypothetical protein